MPSAKTFLHVIQITDDRERCTEQKHSVNWYLDKAEALQSASEVKCIVKVKCVFLFKLSQKGFTINHDSHLTVIALLSPALVIRCKTAYLTQNYSETEVTAVESKKTNATFLILIHRFMYEGGSTQRCLHCCGNLHSQYMLANYSLT